MNPQILETLILVIHILICLTIVGLVLLQQSTGSDMGSGFGSGASGTVFGGSGAGNFLTKTTTLIAIAFFLTSFVLAFFAKEKSVTVQTLGVPQVVEQLPEVEMRELPSLNSDAPTTAPPAVTEKHPEVNRQSAESEISEG